jgi:hypothetical protein
MLTNFSALFKSARKHLRHIERRLTWVLLIQHELQRKEYLLAGQNFIESYGTCLHSLGTPVYTLGAQGREELSGNLMQIPKLMKAWQLEAQ